MYLLIEISEKDYERTKDIKYPTSIEKCIKNGRLIKDDNVEQMIENIEDIRNNQ